MEVFEGYWRKTPHIKRLIIKVVPDETTRLAMLKNGQADIAYLMVGAIGEEVKRDSVWHIGVGPRVADASLGKIPLFYYTGPFEVCSLGKVSNALTLHIATAPGGAGGARSPIWLCPAMISAPNNNC